MFEYYLLRRALEWFGKLTSLMGGYRSSSFDICPRRMYQERGDYIVKLCQEMPKTKSYTFENNDCTLLKVIRFLLDFPTVAEAVLSNLKTHHLKFDTLIVTSRQIYPFKSYLDGEDSIHYTDWKFVLTRFFDFEKITNKTEEILAMNVLCSHCRLKNNYKVLKIIGFRDNNAIEYLKQPFCYSGIQCIKACYAWCPHSIKFTRRNAATFDDFAETRCTRAMTNSYYHCIDTCELCKFHYHHTSNYYRTMMKENATSSR